MAESTAAQPPTATKAPEGFSPPKSEWLSGTWYVTHSSLPMWKSKRNVNITYKPLKESSDGKARLDSLVTYQTLTSNKVKTVRGVETEAGQENTGAWNWRGKGWLVIASSHWAVLSYGGIEGAEQWAVTYFEKTLFTPAGIDIYSRSKDGLSASTLEHIKQALQEVDDRNIRELAGVMFEIQHDEYEDA